MKKIRVGIADDEQEIHDLFDNFIESESDYIELEHFYCTTDVESFLEDDSESLNMLFLDLVFENNIHGTQALPYIKKIAPELPVIFLTGHDKTNPDVDYLIQKKLATDYMEKPVTKKVFLNKIKSISNIIDDISNLKREIEDNLQTLEEIATDYEEKYQELYNSWNNQNYSSSEREAFEQELEKLASKTIPERTKMMFIRTYANLEFRNKVIVELFGKNYDPRIFDLLSKINHNIPLGPGEKMQLFPEFGIPNLYEYRISQKARLFVQRRNCKKC